MHRDVRARLAEAYGPLPQFECLHYSLGCNKLGTRGVHAISTVLPKLALLTKLDLGALETYYVETNEITAEGAKKLALGLKTLTLLTSLNLGTAL